MVELLRGGSALIKKKFLANHFKTFIPPFHKMEYSVCFFKKGHAFFASCP